MGQPIGHGGVENDRPPADLAKTLWNNHIERFAR
jgi:hypothetical protein